MTTNERNKTLDYYNEKAEDFIKGTVDVELTGLQEEFLDYIVHGGTILDLGCGSGRDSKMFLNKGFKVIAVDGSKDICKLASVYIGQDVINADFTEYSPNEELDGVWACASLLHLRSEDIINVINKVSSKLKPNGCFYMSFKYGEFAGMRNGRFFTDMTETSFNEILSKCEALELIEYKITYDARVGREDEKWLNVFCRKTL